MNKKRIGFTLVEIIIALVIMGFIATIGFQVMQIQKTSYTSLAYYAYKNIKNVASEIMLTEMQGKVAEGEQMTTYDSRKEGTEDSGIYERKFKNDKDLEENELTHAKSFCNYMAEMMNTQGTVNCPNPGEKTHPDFRYYQAMDSSRKPKGRISIPKTAHFTTTNGMKYYIGRWQELDDDYGAYDTATDVKENNSTPYGYRIIAVDLNGNGKPNIAYQDEGQLPVDIVTFAIVDNGEVLPLGVAANNVKTKNNKHYRYLSSKVHGYIYRDVNKEKSSYKKMIPHFCTNTGKKSDGKANDKKCDYSKETLTNKLSKPANSGVFTFRQAYCHALQFPAEEIILTDYCTKDMIKKRNNRCPCGNTYDESTTPRKLLQPACPTASSDPLYDICKQEVIKPMFRFNFK